MKSELSIIVPVYNVEQYIDQCISSIIDQSFKRFEVIIVDDGSTDKSGEKCDKWALIDTRIKVFHKKNGGLMSAWKYGLKQSRFDYVGFVDADDWIDDNMYSTLMSVAVEKNADIVISALIKEYESNNSSIKEVLYLSRDLYTKQQIEKELYPIFFLTEDYSGRGVAPNRVTKIFKRELLLKVMGYCDERVSIGEDLLTTFCAFSNAKVIAIQKDFYPYHYRINCDSMINKYSETKIEKIFQLRDSLIKVNKQLYHYDFTNQINTDIVRLLLMEVENIILFSDTGWKYKKNRIRKIYLSKTFQEMLKNSNANKLSTKYWLYLQLLKYRLYTLLVIVRELSYRR